MRSMNSRMRGPWTVRPRARRVYAPGVQTLEGRRLLSSAQADPYAPSDAAQSMLEMINRARANPVAEGRRLLALVKTDPMLQQATQGWDLNAFAREVNGFRPEPPLAFNTRLNEAALDHDAAMLAVNAQVHSPDGYLSDTQVARAADGQAYYPTGDSYWSTGENIFAYSAGIDPNDTTAVMNYFEAGFLLDWGNPDFGHLTNILAPGPGQWSPGAVHYPYSEVGIGLLTNVTPTVAPGVNPIAANNGLNVGPDLVTQEFGWRSGNPILTGSIYVDKTGTGSYAPGEGLGGVSIVAVGRQGQGAFRAQTWASGGYSLALPPGTYDVTAVGGAYRVGTTVTLGTDNVSWEYAYKTATAALPAPAPPAPQTPAPTPALTPAPAPKARPTPAPAPPVRLTHPTPPKHTPPSRHVTHTGPVVSKPTPTRTRLPWTNLLNWGRFSGR